MNDELTTLVRIAEALERIARHLEGAPAEMENMAKAHAEKPEEDGYAAAVKALVDMPDDIPEAPAPKVKPPKREEVIAALNRLAKAHGIEAGKKVLDGRKLADIPEGEWAGLIAMCDKLVTGGA